MKSRWHDCSTSSNYRQLRLAWWTQQQQQEAHQQEQVVALCPLQQQLGVGLLVVLSQVLVVYHLGFMLNRVAGAGTV